MSANFNPAASFNPATAAAPPAPQAAPTAAPAFPQIPAFGADSVRFGNAEDNDGESKGEKSGNKLLEGLKGHFEGVGKNPLKLLFKLFTFPFKLPLIVLKAFKGEKAEKAGENGGDSTPDTPPESTDS